MPFYEYDPTHSREIRDKLDHVIVRLRHFDRRMSRLFERLGEIQDVLDALKPAPHRLKAVLEFGKPRAK